MSALQSDTVSVQATADRLPISGLLALAMTGFIGIMTETMPAGLLPQIAGGLNVSQSMAGQTVTAYASGSLLAAIPLTVATRGWRRKKVLLLSIIGFLIFNTLTATSGNYWLTMTARFFAGVAAGLAWSLLAGYARRMVPPHQQGKAIATALVGTPIALSLGLPIGTWLGTFVGWRTTFGIMSALTLVLIMWVIAKVPDFPGQAKGEQMSLWRVITTPGVRSVLGVVIAWMLAHNILYTYIAPFVKPANLADRVDLVLLVFGAMALVGIWVTGKLVDHNLRRAVLISLLVFALTSVALAVWNSSPIVVLIGIGIWGLTFGGAGTLLQTALADTAGSGADVALSINVVGWNGAIAGGGVLGGLMLTRWGAASFPWAVVVLLAVAFLIAWMAKNHGFPPGHRLSKSKISGH